MWAILKGCKSMCATWRWHQWTIAIAATLYAAIFIFMLIVRPGTPEQYHAFFNVYQGIAPLFAAVCGIFASFLSKHLTRTAKVGWFLIGIGCLSFAVGQATWTYFESILNQEVPFPGWPDAGYLGTYPFLIVGTAMLFNSSQKVGRARLLMDSAIAASSIGMLSWYFIIDRIWAKTDVGLVGKLISVGYPLGDIAVIFMAIVTFNSVKLDRVYRRSLALLAIGVLMVTFADTVFTLLSLNDSYETGSWNDWGWSFGWLLCGFSSLNLVWSKKSETFVGKKRSRRTEAAFVALRAYSPYLASAGALAFTFGYDFIQNGSIKITSHGEALLLAALLMVRQLFMVQENVGLTRHIKAINDDLEQRVETRTRDLTNLQALARSVNMTLSIEKVLVEGSKHAAELLEADAIAIWLYGDHKAGSKELNLRHSNGFDGHEGFLDLLTERAAFARENSVTVAETLPNGSDATSLMVKLVWHNEEIGVVSAVRWAPSFEMTDKTLLEAVLVELGSALRNSLRHAQALEAADHDAVTGLLNHRAFHQRFLGALKRAQAQEEMVSVIIFDLNNFKLFNDTYGHMNGDKVLKTVAKSIIEVCPERSLMARYGGDEFVVGLVGASGEQAEVLAKELAGRLSDLGFTKAGDERKIPITLSAGVATYPHDGTNRHDLFAIADQNLYSAKASEAGVVRTSEQQRANRALRTEGSFEVLDALVSAVDNKDRYTRKHSEDVTEYALWIAEELGLSEETMRTIRIAGLLHDVGKIGVPDEVLRKPGRLTPEEYELMKRHPRLGELIVGAIPGMEGIVDGVRSHHERWDGHGYPDQLAGDSIPFLGRILAVADAFSAMTTDRPYRKGMDWNEALKQIEENRGTQFDPELADIFLRVASYRANNPENEELLDAA